MLRLMKNAAQVIALLATILFPTTVLSDGLSSAGVRDARVANVPGNQRLVPCPRLNQPIPERLAAQMDCGAGFAATPEVAGERVRNTGGIFRSHRIGSAPPANADDDDPISNSNNRDPDNNNDGPSDDPNGPPDRDNDDDGNDDPDRGPDPDDGDSDGPKTKQERLSELGVEQGDLKNQNNDFRNEVSDYLRENGKNADWTDFNPTNEPSPAG